MTTDCPICGAEYGPPCVNIDCLFYQDRAPSDRAPPTKDLEDFSDLASLWANVCDCCFDRVPLQGPDPNCPVCDGTGEKKT